MTLEKTELSESDCDWTTLAHVKAVDRPRSEFDNSDRNRIILIEALR